MIVAVSNFRVAQKNKYSAPPNKISRIEWGALKSTCFIKIKNNIVGVIAIRILRIAFMISLILRVLTLCLISQIPAKQVIKYEIDVAKAMPDMEYFMSIKLKKVFVASNRKISKTFFFILPNEVSVLIINGHIPIAVIPIK